MFDLMLATQRFETIIEILHNAWMLDTYDSRLRHDVRRSAVTICWCFNCSAWHSDSSSL